MINQNIIDKLHSMKIQPHNIITYGLCLNAFGLLSLLYGEFILFIMLFASTIYISHIFKAYNQKYNLSTNMIKLYYNVGDYIKILTTYFFFTGYKFWSANKVNDRCGRYSIHALFA